MWPDAMGNGILYQMTITSKPIYMQDSLTDTHAHYKVVELYNLQLDGAL